MLDTVCTTRCRKTCLVAKIEAGGGLSTRLAVVQMLHRVKAT
jgi:hypothetical protein